MLLLGRNDFNSMKQNDPPKTPKFIKEATFAVDNVHSCICRKHCAVPCSMTLRNVVLCRIECTTVRGENRCRMSG